MTYQHVRRLHPAGRPRLAPRYDGPAVARRLPHEVYLVAGARAASVLGNVVAVTALLLDFHDRGAGAWAVAGLLAMGALPIVLLAPLVGSVVDRVDSRVLIVASSLWQAAACALLAFVAGAPALTLVLVAMNACGTAVTNPLFLALTSVMVPGGRLAAANSVQQGAVTIATMAGPAAGGLITGLTGGAAVALAVLLPLVVHLIYVAQVFLVRDTFGASSLAFGMLQATQMAGLLIGTVLASRLNTARRIMLGSPLSAAVMSTAIALIGVVRSLPATFALYAVAGVCMSMVSVSMGTLLLLRTPEPAIGRVMASFTAIHRTAGLVAYGLGGVVVGLLRPEDVYLLSGVGALVIVLALAPAFRRAWVRT